MRLSWAQALATAAALLWLPGTALCGEAMERLIEAVDAHGTAIPDDQAAELIRLLGLATGPEYLAMKEVARPDVEANQRRFAIVRRRRQGPEATVIFTWTDAQRGWYMLSDQDGRLLRSLYAGSGRMPRSVAPEHPNAVQAFDEQRSFWTGWAEVSARSRPKKNGGTRTARAPVPREKPASMRPGPPPDAGHGPAPQSPRPPGPPTKRDDEAGFWD